MTSVSIDATTGVQRDRTSDASRRTGGRPKLAVFPKGRAQSLRPARRRRAVDPREIRVSSDLVASRRSFRSDGSVAVGHHSVLCPL